MDFTDRGARQPQQTNSNNNLAAPPPQHHDSSSGKKPKRFARIKNHSLLNISYIALLFSITILIIGVVSSIFLFDENSNKESKIVDTSKYQAVFLNGGQVYFGKISELNSNYLALSDIYYLQVNQSVQPDENKESGNNFTLAKLGCELHRPQDVMVINHEQVVFWENLKDDDSQNTVPGGIKKLKESNPNQDCQTAQQSNTNTDSSTNSTDPNSNTPATTTPPATGN